MPVNSTPIFYEDHAAADNKPVSTVNALPTYENSIKILTGGQSQPVAISTTSAQSTAINVESILVYATVDCFVRQGANPTALSNGTDQPIIGGSYFRVPNIIPGNKLAFITASGTGTVYITPGA